VDLLDDRIEPLVRVPHGAGPDEPHVNEGRFAIIDLV
jgi:hypothetical protein